MSSFRKERVGDLIHSCVASQLREMHDPRLTAITVTEVKMTPDLKIAKVYYSALGQSEAISADALKHARTLLRKHVAQILKLRFTPDLHFFFDNSVEEGNKIEALLSSIRREET